MPLLPGLLFFAAAAAADGTPSLRDLEAAGAVIGEIRIVAQDIFDPENPKENSTRYRVVNTLHINTRDAVIRNLLLFKSGDRVSVQAIEETERLLRSRRYFHDVTIRPVGYQDGVVDIEVKTRDTWTLEPGGSAGRAGGINTGEISLEESNLLGTGILVGLTYKSDQDRSASLFNIGDDNILGSRLAASYSIAKQSDGKSQVGSLARPFYSLDSRWAAGVSAQDTDQLDSIFTAGESVAAYRHRRQRHEAYAGWSRGLVDKWTQRYSLALRYDDHDYELDPAEPPPNRLPADLRLVGPLVRVQVIQDNYRKGVNLNRIGRTEDLALGLQLAVELGYAFQGLGSTADKWFSNTRFSWGTEPTSKNVLLTEGELDWRYGTQAENVDLHVAGKFFHHRTSHHTHYVFLSGDYLWRPDAPGMQTLGGDNGLRGYPSRYQTGDRRVLLTLETRAYSDWYPFQLFRVGAAAFFDIGRAWGGEYQNTANPGWLPDVGFGLRISNDRTASANVLHIDIAFPLRRDPKIEAVQFLVGSKVSF